MLEISSFQLDGMYEFRADIAVLLNITPDHLDRYGNQMQNYINSKFRITRNMAKEDCFIFCSDDEITIEHLNRIIIQAQKLPFSQKTVVEQGACVEETKCASDMAIAVMKCFSTNLRSRKHNIYNSMAAAITGKIMNITNSTIREALTTFKE